MVKTFWNIPLPTGEGEKKVRELGRDALILSVFSVTSFALLYGLSGQQFSINSIIIQLLFLSILIFFICSEVSRNAKYYCEYAFADILYLIASFMLFFDFTILIFKMQIGLIVAMTVGGLLGYLILNFGYSLYMIVVQIKQILK